MPDSFDYTTGTNSENVRLLQALIDEAPEYTEETNSRNANILKSIINNTEYTDAPQSEIEELLLRLKAKIGGEIEVDELTVTENGTYDAGVNKAYNPVTVELPLSSKTITENGTYQASDDNLAGFNEVTVAVEGYAKKSIENTPTAIATFNASALPMPSLKVGISAVQSGTGDPSPTNVRPISGWSAVNRYRTGINVWDEEWEVGGYSTATGEKTTATNRIRSKAPISVKEGETIYCHTNVYAMRLFLYDAKGEYITSPSAVTDGTYTIPADIYYITFHMGTEYGTTYNNDVSINYPSTDTDYHAYNGTTYTTTLKDGQGNPMECYGGQFENVNGQQKLTNTYDAVDMGDLNWTYSNGFFGTTDLNSLMKMPIDNNTKANIISEQYTVDTWNHITASMSGKMAKSRSSAEALIVCDTNYTDVASFKNAVTGVKLMYELATPQQIPQDNLAIATQEGTNNLWADTGDVLSGEYLEAL